MVFVKDGAVWKAQLAAPEQASEVAKLAVAPSLVQRVTAASDGSALLVDLGENAAWIDLSATGAPLLLLPCRAGRLAADGNRVLCEARVGGGAVSYRTRPRLGAVSLPDVDPRRTALVPGAGGERVVTEQAGKLVSAPLGQPAEHTEVAPHAPAAALTIAPDGRRAVGHYADAEGEALYGFQLDGRAARRKLMAGVPVAWSADSVWLAVDGVSGEDSTACVIRAIGGEYKCWDRYRAVGLTADGGAVLLAKPAEGGSGVDVFLGRTTGARAEKPKQLIAGVNAATLVP